MTIPLSLRHHYRPRGAAAEVFRRRDPELLLSGPAGTGKSPAALEKIHAMMLKNPGARGLIVRKTLVSLGSTGLVTWREKVAAESIAAGYVRWFGGSQQEAAAYRYSNGSVVVVGGLDKPQKVMSSEYDVIFVQEAIELAIDDWEALTTRLRNGRVSFQQLLADCNSDTPTHWLKQRADRGDTLMLYSRHEDNPVLFREDGTLTEAGVDYIGKLDKLTGVCFHRHRRGQWVAAEGLIYEEYDPAVHLVDRFDVPEDWTRWWSVDFGIRTILSSSAGLRTRTAGSTCTARSTRPGCWRRITPSASCPWWPRREVDRAAPSRDHLRSRRGGPGHAGAASGLVHGRGEEDR